MVDWNPNFPETFGNEWMITHDHKNRVWGGAPGRIQRLHSTVTETISALKLSANLDPLSRNAVPTLIDVFEEGNDFVGLPKIARLVPNSDNSNEGWTRSDGSSSSLFSYIDDNTLKWPNPNNTAQTQWVRAFSPQIGVNFGFNASIFNTGGAAENGRIYWVGVGVIMGANTGFRKLGLAMQIDGLLYPPAAGGIRDVHGYGQIYEFWWGELNPKTNQPWTPADIAKFDTDSTWGIFIRSQNAASAGNYPKVNALSLNVAYADVENRVAVGVWRREEDVGTLRLQNVTTDFLLTLPAGTSDWAKVSGQRYLYFWRQSVSPSQYGPVLGDDVRWNGAYQDLGPRGNPPNTVFPLYHSGKPPAPDHILAGWDTSYDQFGRPQRPWGPNSRVGYAIAMVRQADGQDSVDSQPYRFDIEDLEELRSDQKLGQRLVPASSQTYSGVRFPIIPPETGNPTLTVAVHRVSDGVQIGGTYTITAEQVRTFRNLDKSKPWYYVAAFLTSGAALVGGTAYELRFTTTSGGIWLMAVPDCSLAPAASFGGSTSGAFIGVTHHTTRDLTATMVRQPDPPTGVTASIINVPVTTYLSEQGLPTVEHVRVAWTVPAVGMGGLFKRYELERSLDNGEWHRISHVNDSGITSYDNHEVPRKVSAKYRMRAVGLDGRFSTWAESGSVTPDGPGEVIILTSDVDRSKEVVYFFDHESTYPILSNEGKERVRIHGADRQVVFQEVEDRGVGWRTGITIDRTILSRPGGHKALLPLLDLIQSLDIPYVCVMDDQGTHLMGDVTLNDPRRQQVDRYYTSEIEVIPTHGTPVPVEADLLV